MSVNVDSTDILGLWILQSPLITAPHWLRKTVWYKNYLEGAEKDLGVPAAKVVKYLMSIDPDFIDVTAMNSLVAELKAQCCDLRSRVAYADWLLDAKRFDAIPVNRADKTFFIKTLRATAEKDEVPENQLWVAYTVYHIANFKQVHDVSGALDFISRTVATIAGRRDISPLGDVYGQQLFH